MEPTTNTTYLINDITTIIGQSQTGTIIDGQGLGNIFTITPDNGINLTLTNLTLQNGTTPNNGGAIDYENTNNHYGTLNITNVTFTNNTATNGGAINTNNVNINTNNTTYNNNTASNNGGAINNNADGKTPVTMNSTNNTYNNNTASYNGGAINTYNVNLILNNNTFTKNTALNFGGAINYGANGIIPVTMNSTNNTYNNNTASYSGGGAIYNSFGIINDNNSIFIGNSAQGGGGGGAIYNDIGGNLTEKNSVFIGNIANYSHGGAILNGSIAIVNFCKIVGNTASQGNDISNGGTMDATLNWWGTNNPNENNNDIVNSYICTYDPWIVLSVNASPISIPLSGSSNITADLLHDSQGIIHDPVNGLIPYTGSANFKTNNGTIEDANFNNGTATTTLNIGNNQGVVNVSTTVDNQTTNTPVYVGFCFVTVNPVNRVTPTQTITVTFSEPIITGPNYNNIQVLDQNGAIQSIITNIIDNTLIINPTSSWEPGQTFNINIPADAVTNTDGITLTNPLILNIHSTSKHRLCQHRW